MSRRAAMALALALLSTLPVVAGAVVVPGLAPAANAVEWVSSAPWTGASSRGTSHVQPTPDGARVIAQDEVDVGGSFVKMRIRALSATTGATLWHRTYPSESMEGLASGVRTSPDGARVFAFTARFTNGVEYTPAIVAYDAATGAVLWTKQMPYVFWTSCTPCALANAAVSADGSRLFVAGVTWYSGNSAASRLFAVDAATGATLWERSAPGHRPSAVVTAGNALLFAEHALGPDQFANGEGRVSRIDPGTGSVTWTAVPSVPLTGERVSPTLLAATPDGSTVLVAGARTLARVQGVWREDDGAVVALDAGSGGRRWAVPLSAPLTGFDGFILTSVAATDAHVVVRGTDLVAGRTGNLGLFAFSTATGALAWRNAPTTLAWGGRSVAHDGRHVIVDGYADLDAGDGMIYQAFDAATGAPAWQSTYSAGTGGEYFSTSLAARDGRTYGAVMLRGTGGVTSFLVVAT